MLSQDCQEPIEGKIITNMMDTSSTPNNHNSRQVILEGGLPWGFRIQGGSDTGVQLRIARVSIPTAAIHHCADAQLLIELILSAAGCSLFS